MAYDIKLKPKITDNSELENLENRIESIEKHGIDIQVNDDGGLSKIQDAIKALKEKTIELKVELNADDEKSNKDIQKSNAAIAKLVEQLNNLAGFDESKLNKTIDIHVNVDNLTKEITEGLATLNKINPNIIIDSNDLENKFREYTNKVSMYEDQLYSHLVETSEKESYLTSGNISDYKALTTEIKKAARMAKTYLAAIHQVEFYASKDPTLVKRFGEIYTVSDTNNALLGDFKSYYEETFQAVEEAYNNIIKKDKELLQTETADQKAIQKELASTEKNLKALKDAYSNALKTVSGRIEPKDAVKTLARAENTDLDDTAGEIKKNTALTTSEIKKTEKALEGAGNSTKRFATTLSKAIKLLHEDITSLNTEIKPMIKSFESFIAVVEQLNAVIQEMNSPFDETTIPATMERLDELFKQYNSLDGTEKVMKIGVDISNEDKELLKEAANYVKTIQSRLVSVYNKNKTSGDKPKEKTIDAATAQADQKTGHKKTETKSPSKSTVDNINKAITNYNKLVDKDVKINLIIENFQQLQEAVGYYEELKPNIASSSSKSKTTADTSQKSGVFKSKSGENAVPKYAKDISAVYDKIKSKEVTIKFLFENQDTLYNISEIFAELERKKNTVIPLKTDSTKGSKKRATNVDTSGVTVNQGNDSNVALGLNSIFEQAKLIKSKLDSILKKIPTSDSLSAAIKGVKEEPQVATSNQSNNVSDKSISETEKSNNQTNSEIIKNLNTIINSVSQIESQTKLISDRFTMIQKSTPTTTNNEPNNTFDSNVPEDIMTSIKFATETMETLVTRVDTFLDRLSLRYPVLRQKSDGTVTPVESTDKESIGSTDDKTVLNAINADIKSISSQIGDLLNKLETIHKKIPTAKSIASAKSDTTPKEASTDNSGNDNQLATLIDPKLSAIQTSLTNIETKLSDGSIAVGSKQESNEPPVASADVKEINKNVSTISTKLDNIDTKVGEIKKKTNESTKTKSETKSKSGTKTTDHTATIKDKVNNLPTYLSNIRQTNSTISKNSKNIQTNTGNTSTKVGQVRDTIKTKADNMISHLSALEGKADNDQPNNLPTADNITSLQSALKDLTTAIQSPRALENAQGNQNLNNAPSTAEAAANLANVSDMRVQAENRLKEFRKVLGIMSGGEFSDIFGSTHDIEAYITSLETLNKEIASAGKLLNRGDISSTQRANAQNMLHTNNAILNGYINGDDSLGISTAQINNINSLLASMETINSRIGKTDSALESLKKLKTTLESYNITIQPLEDAINTLNATKTQLQNMTATLSSSSLTEGELSALQATIASEETSYQNAINTATTMLDTDQADSLHSVTNSFVEAEREVGKYSGKLNELKKFLQDLKNKQVDLTAFNMGNGKTAKDMQDFINNYEQFLNTNNTLNDTAAMQNFANNFAANYQTPLKQFVNNLQDARLRFSEMNAEASQISQGYSFDKQLSDMATRVTKWGNSNSQALKVAEFNAEYQRILTSLTNGSTTEIDQLKKLKSEFAMLTLRVNQAGVATKSLTQKLKEMFKKYGGWTLVTRTLNTAMRLLRSMVTQVKEVDTAMTNLSKVTEATGRQLDNFLESAGKRSVDLGASLTDYINAVSEFSRLGKNLDEAQKLGELATTYKTVAEDLDIKTASQSLISTMQAYSNMGVQAEEIVDKFNYVGNNFAISSADIGVSLQKSAASLNAAENSLAESIGLITAGNEIVQNAEVIGTHLKTISARIRGATSELGDDAEEMTITTSELRKELKALTKVDIMIDDNHFKSTYQILKEISEVYDTLTGTQKSSVAELLGGKVSRNTIESILSNFETAQEVVKELDEGMAKGSATKELEKSLDSIQGKLGQLQSTWQQFSKDLIESDTVKGVVDIIKDLTKALDSLVKVSKAKGGILGGAFGGALVGGIANNAIRRQTSGNILGFRNNGSWGINFMPGIQPQSLMSEYDYYTQSAKAIVAKKQGKDLSQISGLNTQLREFIANTDDASISLANFYASQTKSAQGFYGSIQAIKTYNSISEQHIDQRRTFAKAVAVSNKALGEQLENLNGANAGAKAYFSTIKIGAAQIGSAFLGGLSNVAISAAIGALIQAIKYFSESYERLQEKYAEFADDLKETNNAIEEQRDTIQDLITQYTNIILTTSDLSTEQSQLIDIQKEISKAIGDETGKINLLNKSLGENIAIIQKKRKEEAKGFVNETKNQKRLDDAKKYLEESAIAHWERGFNGQQRLVKKGNYSEIEATGYGDWDDDKEVNKILGRFRNIVRSNWSNYLYVEGTVEEQLETLSVLNEELTRLWGNKPLDANQHEWLKSIQDRIDTLESQIEEAKKYISEWDIKQALANATDIDSKTIKNIDKIQEVVEILKTATSSSDIIKASDSYEALKEGILAAIPEDNVETRDMLTTYFDNIEKTIDQGLLDITNKGTVYAQTLKKFQDETYDKVTGSISKLDSAIKSVSLGESIDASSVVELAKIDSSLLNQFHRTADGYTVSLELLSKAREKLIKEQSEDIKKEIAENEKYITDQQAILKHLREELAKAGGKDATTENAIKETEKNIEQAAERTDWWNTLLQLVANSFDTIKDKAEQAKSSFDSSLSDVKSLKDSLTSLYSKEGLDDSFFADHPELLKYKGDVEKLSAEIQKMAKTKTAPALTQLSSLLYDAKKKGDVKAIEKYTSMIKILQEESDFTVLEEMEKQKKVLREQIEAKERYIKGLERQKEKEQQILDALNKQKEELEKIVSDYETAAKTAESYIDEQIEALDKQTDALEENKKAIEDDFDARIQAIKDAMDAIDAEADALDKEAEQQERLNDLKEKELALEKARQTKVRVYDATRGFRIENNSEEIAKAQKDYNDALNDYNKWKAKEERDARKAELQAQIDLLEKEKEAALDAIDKQIEGIEAMKKEFEEYKKLWEDTLNSYQKLQDEMTAAAILGSDWREKIAQKDVDIVNTFGANYNSVQEQLHGVVEKQIEDVQRVIDSYDQQIEVQNNLKSAQESYLGYYENYSEKFVNLTDKQTAALERLNQAINGGDSEGALDAVLTADAAFAENNPVSTNPTSKIQELISKGQTDAVDKFLKTAPSLITDQVNTMLFNGLPPIMKNMLHDIVKTGTENMVQNDNRSVVVNNPSLSMTYEQFMGMLSNAFAQLDRDTKVGRR